MCWFPSFLKTKKTNHFGNSRQHCNMIFLRLLPDSKQCKGATLVQLLCPQLFHSAFHMIKAGCHFLTWEEVTSKWERKSTRTHLYVHENKVYRNTERILSYSTRLSTLHYTDYELSYVCVAHIHNCSQSLLRLIMRTHPRTALLMSLYQLLKCFCELHTLWFYLPSPQWYASWSDAQTGSSLVLCCFNTWSVLETF